MKKLAVMLAAIICISAASMEPLLYGMQETEHPSSGTISGSKTPTHTSSQATYDSQSSQGLSMREVSISQSIPEQASQPPETIFYIATRTPAATILSSIARNHRNGVQEPLEPPSCWERVKERFRSLCKNPEPYISDEGFQAFISQHMIQAVEENNFFKVKMYESLITARNQQAVLDNQNSATRGDFIMTALTAGLIILMKFINTPSGPCECLCQ